MKAILFVPVADSTAWIDETLPGVSPAELPVAGRSAIEYALEEAAKAGYDMAEVLDYRPSDRLAAAFADPSTTPLPVFYIRGEGAPPRTTEELKKVSSPLTLNLDNGETTVVWGLKIGDIVIDGVRAWHKANLEVVRNSPQFTLPCYSAEKGIYLGRNVVIERGTEIKPSALLCDNVWLKRNVSLDGDVIIGSGSFVGEGARLKNTVVCPDTYIGAELVFENKIVAGNRIIDLETEAWAEVEEPGLVRPIGGGVLAAFKWLWRFLLGRSCGGGRG